MGDRSGSTKSSWPQLPSRNRKPSLDKYSKSPQDPETEPTKKDKRSSCDKSSKSIQEPESRPGR